MGNPTFSILNFGCRASQSDGAALEQALLGKNLEKGPSGAASDVVVINTCTVTRTADAQARQAIRRIHRHNPQAGIVVTGCYAQRAPEEIARMEGVTCVVGNSHKQQLATLVAEKHLPPRVPPDCAESEARLPGGAEVYCSSIFESRELRSIADMSGGGRTRAFLKVQDGCSYRCSYCVIPFVRGDSRSLPLKEVLRQTRHLLNQGYKEIVLTGIHLGGYGRDLQPRRPSGEPAPPVASGRAPAAVATQFDRTPGSHRRDHRPGGDLPQGWPSTSTCRCRAVPAASWVSCAGPIEPPGTWNCWKRSGGGFLKRP